MTGAPGRDGFFEHKNDIWGAFHWVVDRPDLGSGAVDVKRLADDLAVRELITAYTNGLDAGNAGDVMACFADDAILVAPVQTLSGKDEIERFHRNLIDGGEVALHRVQNIVVRLEPSGNEGWVVAYIQQAPNGARAQLGHYFGRVMKRDGRWRFADWRISLSFAPRYAGSATGRALTPEAQSQRRELLARPSAPSGDDARLNWLMDELKIRELLAGYCFAQDAKDMSWLTSLFARDATLDVNGRVCHGHAQIVAEFEKQTSAAQFAFRRASNPIIRFDADQRQGWLSVYLQTASASGDGKRSTRFASASGRLVKEDNAWRIADWKIAGDLALNFGDGESQYLFKGHLPALASGTPHEVPFQGSRARFYEVARDLWAGARWICGEPIRADTPDEKIALLVENIRVRDHFVRYVSSHDSSNVARVMAKVIADDSIQVPREKDARLMVGKDEIRQQYRLWSAARRISYHRLTNMVVRILPGGGEAWGCGYFNAPLVSHVNEPVSEFGGYFFRFLKENGEWRIADRRSIGPGAGEGVRVAKFRYAPPVPGDAGSIWY